MNKVILISIDGMRPDAFKACGHPFTEEMLRLGTSTLEGRTVFPSVTLPCHLSMFYSVPPERHGVITNQFSPFPRPVTGLFEHLKNMEMASAFVYGWEQLRDIGAPGCLKYAEYIKYDHDVDVDTPLTEKALRLLEKDPVDFLFLYLPDTDERGHDYGWMTDEQLKCVHRAIGHVEEVYRAFGDRYTILVTADHGGHGRTHGTPLPEDMTIPIFGLGDPFPAGGTFREANIMDIAPTVTTLMGLKAPSAWEGQSLTGKTQ